MINVEAHCCTQDNAHDHNDFEVSKESSTTGLIAEKNVPPPHGREVCEGVP